MGVWFLQQLSLSQVGEEHRRTAGPCPGPGQVQGGGPRPVGTAVGRGEKWTQGLHMYLGINSKAWVEGAGNRPRCPPMSSEALREEDRGGPAW